MAGAWLQPWKKQVTLVMSRSASVIQVQGGLDVAAVRLPADGERDRGVTVVVIAAVVDHVGQLLRLCAYLAPSEFGGTTDAERGPDHR
ncbi:hypothetical protein IU436_29810 [Nocardia farcinica]|uniref:hypothetical protein n=1 Tax=Nocardia farcinica TaxID=37329 RepID=UPI0018938009|nr:hypothetical protein [Nocardia farcinica]MBF6422910.1 hypothetical protein [Nocardia farcinica]MBF6434517.1 hypothetical protein [Nocardia farcinica]MBF6505602.1 hypothetical protein [Nocardia farcinica]